MESETEALTEGGEKMGGRLCCSRTYHNIKCHRFRALSLRGRNGRENTFCDVFIASPLRNPSTRTHFPRTQFRHEKILK